MKRLHLITLFTLFALVLQAQIPTEWQTKYATCNGLKGAALKTKLYSIIAEHTQKSYASLWECYETTDVHSDGTIWDMYSTATDGILYPTDHSGNYSAEGDLLNREHSVPCSWFNDEKPMYTDLFHVIPVDGYVNGRRSNYPYGETSSPTWQSNDNFSKLGPCDASIGYSGTVFEPNDEYKGDLARNYFYMATCYENTVSTWTNGLGSAMFNGTAYPAFTDWAKAMLVSWATTDAVSDKEVNRNNAVYAIQGNRNPFIDYPGLEEYIFGSKTNQAVNLLSDGTIQETDQEATGGGESTTSGDLYEEVTSTSQLVAGNNYIIVYPTGPKTMYYDGSNFKSVDRAGYQNSSGQIDISGTATAVLTLGGSEGAWTFAFTYNSTNYYLQCASKNTLTLSTTANANAQKWTIDLTADDPIACNNTINGTTYYLQYNTADYFRCYAATQKSVKLYVQCESSSTETTPETPTFSSEDGSELAVGSTVTLSCTTSGATIQYSTDGGTSWTTGSSITLNDLGSVTIQARSVLNEVTSSITEVTYTVAPAMPTFSPESGTTITSGEAVTISCATSGATIEYSTDNGTTWTTGTSVTLSTTGSVTVQARATLSNVTSSVSEATYTVSDSQSQSDAYIFSRVTSTSDLVVGARYLIVNEEYGKTLGTQQSNNFAAEAITITDNSTTISATGNVQIITLGGSSGAYTLQIPDGNYLYFNYSSSNYLKTNSSATDAGSLWSIGFDGNDVLITSNAYTDRTIQYNSNNTLFSCYNTTQKVCQLYKEVGGTTIPIDVPTFSPDGGTINTSTEITVTAAGSNAKVEYKIDDATEWTGGTNVSETFTLTEGTHTVTARSNNGTETSSEVSKSFTVEDNESVYFERIYDTDDLVEGGEYLIVYRGTITSGNNSKTASIALGTKNTNYRTAISVDIDDNNRIDYAQFTDDKPAILTIASITSTSKVTFLTDDASPGYLKIPTSNNNYLNTSSTEEDDNTKFIITFSDSIATIAGAAGVRTMGVNLSTTPVSFRSYKAANASSYISLDLQIFAKRSGSFNISKFGWGTFYDQRAYTMPDGITGITITDGLANVETLVAGSTTYEGGDVVPGKTALLLHGDGGTSGVDYDFNYYYAQDKPTDYSGTDNLLHGSMSGVSSTEMVSESGVSEDDYYFYKLTTKNGANVGFYWGVSGGGAFTMNSGHKCWLTLVKTKSGASRGFALDFDELMNSGGNATGINTNDAVIGNAKPAIYDMQGRRVNQPTTPGLYIINGKKTVIR